MGAASRHSAPHWQLMLAQAKRFSVPKQASSAWMKRVRSSGEAWWQQFLAAGMLWIDGGMSLMIFS